MQWGGVPLGAGAPIGCSGDPVAVPPMLRRVVVAVEDRVEEKRAKRVAQR